jgi:precorrin-6A/cobalt-precorrin-6A reductase
MIAVFAGTSEGKAVVEHLSKNNEVKVFVSTSQGAELLKNMNLKNINIEVGSKDESELMECLNNDNVEAIVDATHPYAIEISKNLLSISKILKKKYVRFERQREKLEGVARFETYEKLVDNLNYVDGNVLITSGSNNLDAFCKINDMSRLFVRVMPSSKIIRKCENLGFDMNQIIAVMGPHSLESNMWIMKEKNIKHMVTKESGKNGGVDEKIEAANLLGINIYTIELPKLQYINVCSDFNELDFYIK